MSHPFAIVVAVTREIELVLKLEKLEKLEKQNHLQ